MVSDFQKLREQNNQLQEPIPIYDSRSDEKLIKIDMKEALKELEKSEDQTGEDEKKSISNSRQKQKAAANKMKELSKNMRNSMMAIEGEQLEEDIEVLNQILSNLLIFSLEQENLMLSFEDTDSSNHDYPLKLKEQIKLKEHFEHIDDSLYMLSLRRVEISQEIDKGLSEAHYHIDKSLLDFC